MRESACIPSNPNKIVIIGRYTCRFCNHSHAMRESDKVNYTCHQSVVYTAEAYGYGNKILIMH